MRKFMKSGKNFLWSIINSREVINQLRLRGFRATSLSFFFSTNYTKFPNQIKANILNQVVLPNGMFANICL